MNRWWTYQKERFPLIAHAPLIAAFSACAVSFSSLIAGAPVPGWKSYLVAFGVCLLMFLQLRIADEFKDAEEDARWRPYRPVPRGLIKLSELRWVFIGAAIIQAALALWLDARLLIVLGIAWTYLALMSFEFFCRDWLKKRPVIYLFSHMGIMPLVDFFGTACEWMPRSQESHPPSGLLWFLAASFFNGIVIEFGRKLRQPADEEEGVETYSALWGKETAFTCWTLAMFVTLGCAGMASASTGIPAATIGFLTLLLLAAFFTGARYVQGTLSGKKLELISGIWTLALYLLLGLIPLWIFHHHA